MGFLYTSTFKGISLRKLASLLMLSPVRHICFYFSLSAQNVNCSILDTVTVINVSGNV